MAKPTRHRNKWRIRWTDHTDKRRSAVFDDHKTAKAELARREAEVEEINRGLRAPPMSREHSFDELCDYWLENRAARKRSRKDDESIIRRHLRPSFRGVPVADIGLDRVDAFVRSRSQLSPKTTSNILTLLISMLNVAFDLDWLSRVPRIRKPSVPTFGQDFRYLRSDEEIRRFLRAAEGEGPHVFALYASAVYTGMRAGELAGLRREDVALECRLITVQRSYSGPTKTGDVRHVPILDPLVPILRRWCLRTAGELMFPNQRGTMHGRSARIFQEVLKRVLAAGRFPTVCRRGKQRGYITFHDLRHTFASHWMMRGGDLFKLQKILGHKSVEMTLRYAHLAPTAFAEDYDRFDDWSPSEPATIVTFNR